MTEGLAEQMNRSQAACTWQPRGRTHRIARRSRRAHNRNRRSDPLHRNLVPRRKTPWDVEIVYDTGPTSTEQLYEEPCREQAESMQYFPENEDYLPATSLQQNTIEISTNFRGSNINKYHSQIPMELEMDNQKTIRTKLQIFLNDISQLVMLRVQISPK